MDRVIGKFQGKRAATPQIGLLQRAEVPGTLPTRTAFGYPSLDDSNRRRKTSKRTTHELYQLPSYKRQTASATARDQKRAFSTLAWMIRRHLDNVSRFTPHVQTGNDKVDECLRKLFKWHALRQNFDVHAKHSRDEWMRQFEAVKIISGDCAALKCQGGHMQGIEGDRIGIGTGVTVTAGYTIIRDPATGIDTRISEEGLVFEVQGDLVSENADPTTIQMGGRVIGYAVCRRTGLRGELLKFERIVPAEFCLLEGYWPERFDANRGVSPLLPVLNQCADLMEGREYFLLRMKIGALFGWGFKRSGEDEFANDIAANQANSSMGQNITTPTITETASYASRIQRQIDLASGPIVLDLDDGDEMQEIEQRTPNGEVVPYFREIAREVLLALDLPYTMLDSQKSSYSAREMDRNEFDEAAEWKRDKNAAFLKEIYSPEWCLGLWNTINLFGFGDALASAKMDVEQAFEGVEWFPSGRPEPTADEYKGAIMGIAAGLTNTPRVLSRWGHDAYRIADEQRKYLKKIGVPDDLLVNGLPIFVAAGGQQSLQNLILGETVKPAKIQSVSGEQEQQDEKVTTK